LTSKYRVDITPAARREYEKLERPFQKRLKDAILALENNPRPHGCEKMEGTGNAYRIRAGDYRVIYKICDNVLVVLVIRIGHRREIYR
jgi:mRNA interferase RelE/StbE